MSKNNKTRVIRALKVSAIFHTQYCMNICIGACVSRVASPISKMLFCCFLSATARRKTAHAVTTRAHVTWHRCESTFM